MLEIRVTSAARNDLSRIWFYVAEDNIAAADRLMLSFQNRFELLARNSELGEKRKIGDTYDCRCFSMGKYAIYYHTQVDQLFVLRVLHGARDQDANLSFD